MLFVREPFVAIYRQKTSLPNRLMRCLCVDLVEREWKWIEYVLEWDHISSGDGRELARVLLDPSSYEPDVHEFRWWIDANTDAKGRKQ